MELTESEFENLLASAMKDEIEVPFKTNDKLKKKIKAKSGYKRLMKIVPSSIAACFVIGIVLTSVMHNNYQVVDLESAEYSVASYNNSNEATLSRSSSHASEKLTLIDYLENNQKLIGDVSRKVKEKMSINEDIKYFEDFTTITGNENYYLTEENELVIIFEPGMVATEENGEIYINVGVIK